jgi:hypothetical protein
MRRTVPVPARHSYRTKRSMPSTLTGGSPDLWDQAERQAQSEGRSVDQLVEDAIRLYLRSWNIAGLLGIGRRG